MKSDQHAHAFLLLTFAILFFLLAPLGRFASWIPGGFHRGFYSLIDIDPGDDTSFYSFLRSTYFDGDLDFTNESWLAKAADGRFIRKGLFQAEHITKTGYTCALTHGIGNAYLWAPFLAVGHLASTLFERAGVRVQANPETPKGYRFPELISTGIGSAFWCLLGLLLFYQIYRREFGIGTSFLAVLAVLLTTEIPYYAFVHTRMTHAHEVFAIGAAMWFWEKIYRREADRYDFFLMIFFFGFLSLVRMNNFLYLLLPLSLYAVQGWERWRERRTFPWPTLARMSLIVALSLVVLLPMFFVLHLFFDTPFVIDASGHYRLWSQGQEIFALEPSPALAENYRPIFHPLVIWENIKIFSAIFTPQMGFLWSTPAVVLGWIGLVLLCFQERQRGLLFLLGYLPAFLMFHYKLGDEYGHRYLISSLFFIGYGIAGLLRTLCRRFSEKRVLRAALTVILLWGVWSYLQVLQYKTVISYNDPSYTFKAFRNLQYLGQTFPLWRSSSLAAFAFFLRKVRLESGVDWLFLLLTPLFAMTVFGFGVGMFSRLFARPLSKHKKGIATFSLFAVILASTLMFRMQNPPFSREEILSRLLHHAESLSSTWPGNYRHHHVSLYLFKLAAEMNPADGTIFDHALHASQMLASRYEAAGDVEQAQWFSRQALALEKRSVEPENPP